MIPSTNPESPEHCLQLPPSIDLGTGLIDEATGKRFAQPNISYYLRAAVTVTVRGIDSRKSLETFLPVIITPHTEELPPTDTADFPTEFKEQESKVLRRSLFGSKPGSKLGAVNASLQEPPALSYTTSSDCSSTEALLKLELESIGANPSEIQKILQGISFTVYSLVRFKTFYSVKSFPRLPSQTLLQSCNETRLREGIIKLETRTVQNASWGYRVNIEDSTDATTTSQTSLSNSPKKDLAQSGKWISNWTVPIEINGRILPTFCSSMAARLYSLIVRVKVTGGARHESFDLEVPLQVIHTALDNPESTSAEPIRERFLEYRRASETSWFSDESLVKQINALHSAIT